MFKKLMPLAFTAFLPALFMPIGALAEIQWQTTHGFMGQGPCRLVNSSLRATVQPGYLDVEEDVEIATTGNVVSGGDAQTLEIFGEFDMVPGSTIVGMLLWNGDQILKARLKGKQAASDAYENVVDRKPVVPMWAHDPALLESMGDGHYRFEVYPVPLGKSRHLRLRYHIPCQVAPSGIMLRLASVFAPQISNNPGKIEVRFENGGGTATGTESAYMLYFSGKPRPLAFPSTYIVSLPEDIFLTANPVTTALETMTRFDAGQYQGYYVGLYAQVPDKIVNYPSLTANPTFSVVAVVKNRTDSYALDLNCTSDNGFHCDPLEFHGKAATAWSPEIVWKLYNSAGRELLSLPQTPPLFSKNGDSSMVALWAGSTYPFAEVKEKYLGVKYGFVDASVSLLALEQDSLAKAVAALYVNQGVPRLAQADIFPPDTSETFTPVPVPDAVPYDPNNPDNQPPSTAGIHKLTGGKDALTARIVNRGFAAQSLELTGLASLQGNLHVTLYALDGTKIISFDVERNDRGSILLPLPALRPGFYFLKLKGRGIQLSQKVLLR